MPEANNQQVQTPIQSPTVDAPNWEALAKTLGVNTVEEAQQRAWAIADFVGGVENDQNSELILKRGGMQVPLKLKK
jgi:hypothetical protein